MSYLNTPRLHVSGRFRVDVSTVNNTPENFGDSDDPPDPSWNPNGSGSWRLENCRITGAVLADGTVARTAADDSVVGSSIAQIGSARLVDLDSQQQLVSQIWGMQLRLADPGGNPAFSGAFRVTAFSDLWFKRAQVPGGGDRRMSAFYQSVLTGLAWSEQLESHVLNELRSASASGRLSIKFNVDGFIQSARIGRIVGAIGPALPGEPEHFVLGRHCMPVGADAPIWFFPAIVDKQRGKLIADFGNALPTTSIGGAPVDSSLQLDIGLLATNGGFSPFGRVSIGPAGWYEQTAGICEFPADRSLSAAELTQLQASPIAVRAQTAGGPSIVAREGSDGLHVRAETFVYRMSANDQVAATLQVTRFGQPVANADIAAAFDSTWVPPPDPKVGLTFPSMVKTDSQGIATLPLKAGSIDQPRKFIDGQVYGVGYSLPQSDPAAGGYRNTWNFISVLVWSDLAMPSAPTWLDHVQQIFKQYARLYPVMKDIVQLDNYDDVVANKDRIRAVFMLPEDDPRYMPVTRDLSPAKRQMILNWLQTTGNAGKPNFGTPSVAGMTAVAAVETAELDQSLGGKTMAIQRLKQSQA
jgi:hypothetical protein